MGWVQFAIVLAYLSLIFYVIYYRLPEPRLFDGHLNELFRDMESMMRNQTALLSRIVELQTLIAAGDSADENPSAPAKDTSPAAVSNDGMANAGVQYS
ncbi:MAG TPA: hypothetical protein VHZ09_19375 [Acidobacteriaceae bacterium]|jgi:hypothetical protein|nr:hypothetical protein [Acidobacteriaceae bacterium]